MRRGIKLVIPKIPLTLHSPSRGKAVLPFRGYHFCLAGARAQTPQGALELVVPVRKLCGADSACAFVSQGDLINQHNTSATKLLGSFRYCLLMETTSAKTAAKNRMNAGSPSYKGELERSPKRAAPVPEAENKTASAAVTPHCSPHSSFLLPSLEGCASHTAPLSPFCPSAAPAAAHTPENLLTNTQQQSDLET